MAAAQTTSAAQRHINKSLGAQKDAGIVYSRRTVFKERLAKLKIPRRSAIMEAQAGSSSQASLTALPVQPTGAADPKAAKLEGQLHRHLVEQHGYQSSDPEDYMELDLFGAPHQDALASDEARHWAERYNGGLSDSDDFSQGEGEDWLAGQTVLSGPDLARRRQKHLEQLTQLYEKQTQRLQHVLAARRREYLEAAATLRQEVSREQARAAMTLEQEAGVDEDGSVPIPPQRQTLTLPLPRGLDLDEVDPIRTGPFATAAEAVVYVKMLRASEAAPVDKMRVASQSRHMQCIVGQDNDACKQASLPYSRFCLRHIAQDPDQHLYRACGAVEADGTKCTRPVRKGSLPGDCAIHRSLASFVTNPRLCARLDTGSVSSAVLGTINRVDSAELEQLVLAGGSQDLQSEDPSVAAIKTALLSATSPSMDTALDAASTAVVALETGQHAKAITTMDATPAPTAAQQVTTIPPASTASTTVSTAPPAVSTASTAVSAPLPPLTALPSPTAVSNPTAPSTQASSTLPPDTVAQLASVP